MPLPVDRPKAGSVVKREESSRLVVEVHMLSLAMDIVGDNWPPLFYILALMSILRVSGPVRSLLSIYQSLSFSCTCTSLLLTLQWHTDTFGLVREGS